MTEEMAKKQNDNFELLKLRGEAGVRRQYADELNNLREDKVELQKNLELQKQEAYAWKIISIGTDIFLLENLRGGDSTNAVHKLESVIDFGVLDAMRYRPSLQGAALEQLDKRLVRIARYYEQFPRTKIISTNASDLSAEIDELEKQSATNRKQIDAFLHGFSRR